MNFIWVVLGGFLGAVARFAVSSFFKARYGGSFPFGTFFINVLGSFLLGFLVGLELEGSVLLLCGTGFMGAFTTFSTLKLELLQLWTKQQRRGFFSYIAASYICGIAAAFGGFFVGNM